MSDYARAHAGEDDNVRVMTTSLSGSNFGGLRRGRFSGGPSGGGNDGRLRGSGGGGGDWAREGQGCHGWRKVATTGGHRR